MKHFLALAVCLSFVPAASAAGRVEAVAVGSDRVSSSQGLRAELTLSADGTRAFARLSRCRENVFDFPQYCEDAVTFALPALSVDPAARTISSGGEVVARWSRFGRFVRLESGYRLGHQVAETSVDGGLAPAVVRRASLYLERVES